MGEARAGMTAAQLDALPVGSVVSRPSEARGPAVAVRVNDDRDDAQCWEVSGNEDLYSSVDVAQILGSTHVVRRGRDTPLIDFAGLSLGHSTPGDLAMVAMAEPVIEPGRAVWPGAGHVLGTSLAQLYGRMTDDPAVLRASAAAALAMARRLEEQ